MANEVLVPEIPETLVQALRAGGLTYHNRSRAIQYHLKRGTESAIIVGLLLCQAYKGKDFKHDGSGANTFFQWVENEHGIKRTQAQRAMSIWRAVAPLIPKHIDVIVDIDYSKLALVAPYMPKLIEDQQVDLLHMAKENTCKDLENNLRELNGEIPTDVCEHTGARKILEVCAVCGKTIAVKEVIG